MDKEKLFDINEVEWQDCKEGMRACVFRASKQATLQYSEIQPEGIVDSHSHPAEQVIYVQEGYIDLTVEGKTYSLTPGCFGYIPSEATHEVINQGNSTCIVIDVFFPEREDREHCETVKDMGHNWNRGVK